MADRVAAISAKTAEAYGCRVTGIDLTQAFCDAATAMSDWVGLGSRVSFTQGDATNLPFENQTFDAAMTIHVAMNIAAKDKMYLEARRVLKPGGGFWPKADIGECTAHGPKTDFGVSITDVNRTRRSWTSVQLDFGAVRSHNRGALPVL